MPRTTERRTFDRPADELFGYLADFSNLEEWDPTFERSERLDDGPLGVGSRFRAVASLAGASLDLELEIVEFDEPDRVVLRGKGDGLRTEEDIRVGSHSEGCEVTYTSEFDTDRSDLLEAAMQPGFALLGKAVMRRLENVVDDGALDDQRDASSPPSG